MNLTLKKARNLPINYNFFQMSNTFLKRKTAFLPPKKFDISAMNSFQKKPCFILHVFYKDI